MSFTLYTNGEYYDYEPVFDSTADDARQYPIILNNDERYAQDIVPGSSEKLCPILSYIYKNIPVPAPFSISTNQSEYMRANSWRCTQRKHFREWLRQHQKTLTEFVTELKEWHDDPDNAGADRKIPYYHSMVRDATILEGIPKAAKALANR